MIRKGTLSGIAIVFLLAIVLQAQASVTGKWQGKTPSGDAILLDLTATKTTVTGTFTYNDERATIADGKVAKNTFTFNASVDGHSGGFTGELATADEIKFWPDQLGQARAIVLTRVKD